MTAASDALAARIRTIVGDRPGIAEKRVIGGIGFMAFGHLAVATNGKGELLVRIDPARAAEALAREGAFQARMGQREMIGYVGVAPDIVADIPALETWISSAIDYVKTLPAK